VKHPLFPRARSIRTRLLLLLTLSVLLTAIAISAVSAILGSRDAKDRVIDQLNSVLTLKENEIEAWTSGLRLNLDVVLSQAKIPDDLAALAPVSAGGSADTQAYYRVLDRFLWAANRMGLFEELFYMDKSGVVRLSTNSAHEGQRLGLNDYFIEGLDSKFIQQPSYSLSLGKMTVVASAPVLSNGETIGVIAGRANLVGLNEIMIERPGLGETGETYLVGSNYRLLTYLRRTGYSIPDTYVRTEGTNGAVSLNQTGAKTYANYAGAQVIGVYDWIPELSVGLIAEQERSEALRSSRVSLWTMGGVAVLATLLAIFTGITLTRRIVRPLAELGATATRIADGELELRAQVTREDEIGTLAHSFNRMTGQLGELVHSLERRSDHLRAINESGRRISSILELDQLLPHVASLLIQVFGYESVRILFLTEEGRGRLFTCHQNSDCPQPIAVGTRDPACPTTLREVIASGTPLLVREKAPPKEGTEGHEEVRAEIAVPILAGEKLVGVLGITAGESQPLDEEDLLAAQTLADQLAIAIENSRLYEHAHELAASRERQRLARDLHDAVSQTLFSVSLIAEVLPRIFERDPEQGRARLEELRQLTRGALAEMRTLLLELRPAALAEANLPDLLKQLAEAVVGRARIPVDVEAAEACLDIPTDVRIALYRIAQEALNNVVKHAGATKASVRLDCTDQGLELTVEDDGSGFSETAGVGKLGLSIMRERAEAVGARIEVTSQPGRGTSVRVAWP
jgi:signal transduction histidine kinase